MNREEYEAQVGKPHAHDSHEVQQQQLVYLKLERWSWATDPQDPVQRDWSTAWYGGPDNDWCEWPVAVPLADALDFLKYLLDDGDLDPEWRWSIETQHFNS